jgi:lysozyme
MKTSDRGLNLIKEFESLELKAYLCPAGVWTIGYGHTKDVQEGDTCTEEQANEWLREDVRWAEDAVRASVKLPLRQTEFDALVSFVFNVGVTAYMRSTLLQKLRRGDLQGAAQQFGRWTRANGRVLRGLVRRRAAERAMFDEH